MYGGSFFCPKNRDIKWLLGDEKNNRNFFAILEGILKHLATKTTTD
jgi:hypothetical protein